MLENQGDVSYTQGESIGGPGSVYDFSGIGKGFSDLLEIQSALMKSDMTAQARIQASELADANRNKKAYNKLMSDLNISGEYWYDKDKKYLENQLKEKEAEVVTYLTENNISTSDEMPEEVRQMFKDKTYELERLRDMSDQTYDWMQKQTEKITTNPDQYDIDHFNTWKQDFESADIETRFSMMQADEALQPAYNKQGYYGNLATKMGSDRDKSGNEYFSLDKFTQKILNDMEGGLGKVYYESHRMLKEDGTFETKEEYADRIADEVGETLPYKSKIPRAPGAPRQGEKSEIAEPIYDATFGTKYDFNYVAVPVDVNVYDSELGKNGDLAVSGIYLTDQGKYMVQGIFTDESGAKNQFDKEYTGALKSAISKKAKGDPAKIIENKNKL